MSKGDWRVARASVLQNVVYGEVLQRRNLRPTVRGGARERGREGGKRGVAEFLNRVGIDGDRR
jgi:hypothetical protein